jgi:hypothetical protein
MRGSELLILLACSGRPASETAPPADAAPTPAITSPASNAPVSLHTERCGPVTIEWMGERPGPGLPARYGTEHLRLSRPGVAPRAWRPAGTLHFSDWEFEACSPSGRWIALPRDRFCPIDVLAVASLWAWLDGDAAPTAVLEDGYDGMAALVCSSIRWTGPDTVSWEAGGETSIVQERDLGAANGAP